MEYNYIYMSNYLKSILPKKIDKMDDIKSTYTLLLNDGDFPDIVSSFVKTMHNIYDYIIENSSVYDATLRSNIADTHLSLAKSFPVLHCLKSFLFNIGYFGELIEDDLKIKVESLGQVMYLVNGQGVHMRAKMSESRLYSVLYALKMCGFSSDSIHFDKGKVNMQTQNDVVFSFCDNPLFLKGLKLLALAEKNESRKGRHNIFLRCDYDVILKDDKEVDYYFFNMIDPLSQTQQSYLLKLHNAMLSLGMKCRLDVFYMNVRLIYSIGSREVWTLSKSIESGYRLLIKSKKNDAYTSKINHFPKPLLEKIQKGYGCNKKFFGENCQMGCHGYSFEINDDLETEIMFIEEWLSLEYEYSGRKSKKQTRLKL